MLHIGNQCGVASTLSQFDGSTVIERLKNDPYHHSPPESRIKGYVGFWARVVAEALAHDILHIHSHDKVLSPWTRSWKRVMHYHGSEIRGRWTEKLDRWVHADIILVSTRDLLEGAPDRAEYFPNPVNPNFYPVNKPGREYAVHFTYGADEEAERIAREAGLPLLIIRETIPHDEMPYLLRQFTHLVEVKKKGGAYIMGSVEDTGSLVSLEALATGLTVLCRDGERRGLPPEHRPEYAARRAAEIYRELLE